MTDPDAITLPRRWPVSADPAFIPILNRRPPSQSPEEELAQFLATPPLPGANPDPAVRVAAYQLVRAFNRMPEAECDPADVDALWARMREMLPAYEQAMRDLGVPSRPKPKRRGGGGRRE